MRTANDERVKKMSNGKFYCGLTDKMMARSGGPNRQQSNFFWPDNEENAKTPKSTRKNYSKQQNTAINYGSGDGGFGSEYHHNNDVTDNLTSPKDRYKQQQKSGIEFYDMETASQAASNNRVNNRNNGLSSASSSTSSTSTTPEGNKNNKKISFDSQQSNNRGILRQQQQQSPILGRDNNFTRNNITSKTINHKIITSNDEGGGGRNYNNGSGGGIDDLDLKAENLHITSRNSTSSSNTTSYTNFDDSNKNHGHTEGRRNYQQDDQNDSSCLKNSKNMMRSSVLNDDYGKSIQYGRNYGKTKNIDVINNGVLDYNPNEAKLRAKDQLRSNIFFFNDNTDSNKVKSVRDAAVGRIGVGLPDL